MRKTRERPISSNVNIVENHYAAVVFEIRVACEKSLCASAARRDRG